MPADVQIFDIFGPKLRNMSGRFLRLVGRLKPGVSLEDAQRDLDRVAAEMRGAFPTMAVNQVQLKLAGLQADAFGDIRPALTVLFAGAAFVLSICCVNVTSLLLARASDRRKEIALRLTLGASRGRILRQLLAEGLVLCFLGGALGIAVGWAGFRGLLAIRPERLARIADASLSWPVLAFAAAASLAAALIFALVPAMESFRLDLIATLRSSGRGWLGRAQRRAGGALVAGEIALGFVLVTSAALTARSLSKMEQVRPGFEPRHLLTFQLPVGLQSRGAARHRGPRGGVRRRARSGTRRRHLAPAARSGSAELVRPLSSARDFARGGAPPRPPTSARSLPGTSLPWARASSKAATSISRIASTGGR